MKTIKLIPFFILSVLFLVLHSCATLDMPNTPTAKEVSEPIPPDFFKKETTLICVIYGRKTYDKHLIRHVTNIYHGKYEFVLYDETISKKYRDIEKYRFIFNYDQTYIKDFHDSPGVYSNQYYIIDRKEDVKYLWPITSSFFAILIRSYMNKLEKERIKNS